MKPLSRKQRMVNRIIDSAAIVGVVVLFMFVILCLTGCSAFSRSVVDPQRQSGTIREEGPTHETIIEVGEPAPSKPVHRAMGSIPAMLAAACLCASPQSVRTETTAIAPTDATTVTRPDGWTITVPKGEKLRITDRSTGGTLDANQSARAAGINTSGEAIEGVLKSKLGAMAFPRLASRSGGMDGSGSSTAFDVESVSGGGAAALYVIGALVMIAGCAAGWFAVPKSPKLAGIGVGLGVLLIGCGVVAQEYPWVFALALVGLIVGAGAWVWQSRKQSADKTALRVVAQQVERLSDAANPESLGRKVKEQVGTAIKRSRVRGVIEKAIEGALASPDPTR